MSKKISIIITAIWISLGAIKAQETITETILLDGQTREYIVYVPEIYDENSSTPLMFNFHGFTSQAAGHLAATRMRPVADTTGFILVYPQGSLFLGSTHWNVGAWTNGSTADDLGFTEAMIDTLSTKYNIDLDRVYACGFSNGGYFSYELACKLSHRIAAIGSVGGKMSSETFDACNPTHPIPVVSIHGTADFVVSYFGSQPFGSKTVPETTEYWNSYNDTESIPVMEDIPNINTADGSTVEYYSYANGDDCTSVDHYRVNGGGHDWVGVRGNQDIDASSVIWNFVSRYDINGLIDCNPTSTTDPNPENSASLIYPNPAREYITLKMDLSSDIECSIYSPTGERILTQTISRITKTINVKSLSPGIYFLKVGSETIKLVRAE